MILIAFTVMVCTCLRNFFGAIISSRTDRDLRNKIFAKVLDFSQGKVKKLEYHH